MFLINNKNLKNKLTVCACAVEPELNNPFSAKGNISNEKIFEKLCGQTKNLVPYLYLIDKKDLISGIFSAAKLRFIDYANYIDG